MPIRFHAIAAALVLLLAACGGEKAPDTKNPDGPTTPSEPGPLAKALDAKKAAGMKMMPDEVKAVIEKSGKEIAALDLESQALNVGARAPDFTLSDGNGESYELKSLLEEGPVVLTFYRGKW